MGGGGGGVGVGIGAGRGLFAKVYLATTTSPYYLQYVCISEEKIKCDTSKIQYSLILNTTRTGNPKSEARL